MAEIKPLKLKRESVAGRKYPADHLPVARILVDTSVAHLDQPYDYLIPNTDYDLVVGALVEVPFASAIRQGYVLERLSSGEQGVKLKFINKVLSNLPIFSGELPELIELAAARYGANSWDILPSVIPPRVMKVESKFRGISITPSKERKELAAPRFTQAIGSDSLYQLILRSMEDKKFAGQLLVIVPDENDLIRISKDLESFKPLLLGSHLANSLRYERYLTALFKVPKLIIGTRSAIFTPIIPGSRILIFNDGDESMYERRYPSWNVRDIAILRSKEHSLIFLSASPSLEIVRFLNLGWFTKSKPLNIIRNSKLRLIFADDRRSEIEVIRNGLKSGNVLVSIGEPGYINAFSCQKCRNIALCDCGGRLKINASGGVPTCSICSKGFLNWTCGFCKSSAIRTVSKGGAKLAEEIAKSIPGNRVIISRGGSRVDEVPPDVESCLVIATYGCEPKGKYSSIVQLNLEALITRVDLRAGENARNLIFNNLLQLVPGGSAYLALDQSHPFAQGILKFDPLQIAQNELTERTSAKLPPAFRFATLEGPSRELHKFAKAIDSTNFEIDVITIFEGTSTSNGKLLLRTDISNSGKFSDFLRSLNRYRSIKSLAGIKVRVDPYSI